MPKPPPVPDGFHTVTPYLVVDDAGKLIEFLAAAFSGSLRYAHRRPDDRVAHAEVLVGNSIVMMGSAQSDAKPTPTSLYLYVPDCDTVYRRALAAGGVGVSEPKDQLYGDRHGAVKDPGGNTWWIATHIEDVSEQELARRMAALA
jgi:PhnB protein